MLSLDEVKQHVIIDADDQEHDDYLTLLIEGAISTFNQYTGRQLVANPNNATEVALTPDIKIGLLLLIGHWFNNREAVVIGGACSEVPMATQFIWQPYCKVVIG